MSVWRVDVCVGLLKVLYMSEELLRFKYACWGAEGENEWKMGRKGSNGALERRKNGEWWT